MKVCKFGGSSLADAQRVRMVCDIVVADADRRVVVVSAPGKRNRNDTKVTDLLIACAKSRLAGGLAEKELAAVVSRYAEIQKDLGLPAEVTGAIEKDLRCRLESDISDAGRFMDLMKAAGEDNSAKLVAAQFTSMGHNASYMDPREAGMLLSDEFGNAQLLDESYENIARAFEGIQGIVVFPGFFGYTRSGDVVTFPRGGSDITGSILAAALKAELYENFTDVDSVFSVDPSIISKAAPISELTYREMRELAYAGFGVLHDEAVLPVVHAGIPVEIKNTGKPGQSGTRIVAQRDHIAGRVIGIASDDGFCAIYVSKYLMNREIGFSRRLLQILEEENLSYEHMPSGIDDISIILRESVFTREAEDHVLKRIRNELNVESADVERGLALIMIVGEGMRFAVGIAARATQALANAGVNIEMMNQGSSEISMMFGVKSKDRRDAVSSLYGAFFM